MNRLALVIKSDNPGGSSRLMAGKSPSSRAEGDRSPMADRGQTPREADIEFLVAEEGKPAGILVFYTQFRTAR